MTSHCDVLIAGAGIIGCTTALALADHGLSVVCAGQDAVTPGVASGAAGAMLGVLGEVTAAEDGQLGEAELLLRHEAALAWPALAGRITDLSGQPVPIEHGTVIIAYLGSSTDLACMAAIRAAALRLGLPCEPVAPASVPYLSPAPVYQPAEALWLALLRWRSGHHG